MSEQRTQYHAGQLSPELEEAIITILTFADGSRIRLTVESPKDEIGLSEAHKGYYLYLFRPLESIKEKEQTR